MGWLMIFFFALFVWLSWEASRNKGEESVEQKEWDGGEEVDVLEPDYWSGYIAYRQRRNNWMEEMDEWDEEMERRSNEITNLALSGNPFDPIRRH